MGAPLLNTRFIGNGTMRQANNPMVTPHSGGLHDIYAKGQKMYGVASTLYQGYQNYQAIKPIIQAGLTRAGLGLAL